MNYQYTSVSYLSTTGGARLNTFSNARRLDAADLDWLFIDATSMIARAIDADNLALYFLPLNVINILSIRLDEAEHEVLVPGFWCRLYRRKRIGNRYNWDHIFAPLVCFKCPLHNSARRRQTSSYHNDRGGWESMITAETICGSGSREFV